MEIHKLDQLMQQMDISVQIYSFLEVKLRQSLKKKWTKI